MISDARDRGNRQGYESGAFYLKAHLKGTAFSKYGQTNNKTDGSVIYAFMR